MNQLDLISRIDRNIDTIFRTARIRIEQTKTNKEALKIEDLYLPKIRRIFKEIIRDYNGRLHLLHEAEKRYGIEIQTLIKSMVTRAYLLGIEYVSRATKKEHLMFLSNSDITNIVIQSDESYRMFWRLVTKHLQVLKNRSFTTTHKTAAVSYRKQIPNITDVTLTDEIFARETEKDNRLLDPETSAKLIGTGIVTSTVALATLKKYRDFKNNQEIERKQRELYEISTDPLVTDFGYADKRRREILEQQKAIESLEELFEQELEQKNSPFSELIEKEDKQKLFEEELKKQNDLFFDEENAGEIPEGEPGDTVVFATEQDANVCPICSSLEGLEWEVDDPSVIVPEADTHPNCRCRLLLKINGNIIAK